MTNYKLYPLQREILKSRLKTESDLRRVFKKRIDFTNIINKEYEERTKDKKRKNWLLIQITGETGSLKSSVAQTIATTLQKDFTEKNFAWQYQEFQDKLANSKPKEVFVLDEMVFQRGIGSTRIKEGIINLVETLRKRQNSMIFCTPTEKFIDDDNVTFTLEPMGIDEDTHTVRCLVKKHKYLGFYYVKLDWDNDVWKAYEKLKDTFIEKSSKQEYQKVDYEKLAARLLRKMPSTYGNKKRRIMLYVEKNAPNMTTQERDLLIEQMLVFMETGIPANIEEEEHEKETTNSAD